MWLTRGPTGVVPHVRDSGTKHEDCQSHKVPSMWLSRCTAASGINVGRKRGWWVCSGTMSTAILSVSVPTSAVSRSRGQTTVVAASVGYPPPVQYPSPLLLPPYAVHSRNPTLAPARKGSFSASTGSCPDLDSCALPPFPFRPAANNPDGYAVQRPTLLIATESVPAEHRVRRPSESSRVSSRPRDYDSAPPGPIFPASLGIRLVTSVSSQTVDRGEQTAWPMRALDVRGHNLISACH